MKDLVYSVPIDTIEVLRERLENATTTIRNDRGMLEIVEESFRRRTITTVTLNTSCDD
jgi:ABC-type tungstate transport system permease subunit